MRIIPTIAALMLTATTMSAETIADLRETIDSINGIEVQAIGQIGIAMDDWMFRSDGTSYRVELAIDREALGSIRGCKFEMFRSSAPCEVSIKAEIQIKRSSIDLLIYEITRLDAESTPPS